MLCEEEKTDYIREVIIKSHDKPMIFAHTRLKMNDLEDAWMCLKTLGQQSLANILFKDPEISRHSLLYRVCEPEDVLYKHLIVLYRLPQYCICSVSVFIFTHK